LFSVVHRGLNTLPSTTTTVPYKEEMVYCGCNTLGINVLRIMLQNSIGDTLPDHWVKGVRMSGFKSCYTVIIIYHYLVDLVVSVSRTVVAHNIVRAIRVHFPLRDKLNEVFKCDAGFRWATAKQY
jgi:hypothetical protein